MESRANNLILEEKINQRDLAMRLKGEAHVRLSSERKCAKTLYVDKIKRIPTKMSKFSCS